MRSDQFLSLVFVGNHLQSLGQELKYSHKSRKVRTSLAILGFIKTPLFKGETNLSPFLSPLIHVDTVGDAIVDTLYSGYGRTVFLPGLSRFLAGIVGLSSAHGMLMLIHIGRGAGVVPGYFVGGIAVVER